MGEWFTDGPYVRDGGRRPGQSRSGFIVAQCKSVAITERIVADHNALASHDAERQALRDLVADALPLIEDEWIGTNGPFGLGGEWIDRARAALAELPQKPG